MVMSQLTLMVAAWAMLMAQPIINAQMPTLTLDTITSRFPEACTCTSWPQMSKDGQAIFKRYHVDSGSRRNAHFAAHNNCPEHHQQPLSKKPARAQACCR